VAKYVPDGVYKLAASTAENALVIMSSLATDTIFLYKYHWAGREKMQSSWSKYKFAGAEVLNAEFIESTLYIVLNKSGKTILQQLHFDAGRSDTDQDYVTRLDYRLDNTGVSKAYNSATNQTTITTPYSLINPTVVTRGTNQGTVLNIVSASGTTIIVSGNHTSTEFYVGERYTMTYEFSEPTLKEPTASGGRVAITGGRLQIKHWLLRYQDSGDFKVSVIQKQNSQAQEYIFTGRIIGGGSNLLGSTALDSGDFRFPVMSKAERIRVLIESDSHLPCQFLSAEWEGNMHLRSRRVNG
jgi:hypothetical protein